MLEENGTTGPKLTAGTVAGEGDIDRSAAGLQYQSYQMGLTARGAMLGVGRRSATDPSAQFSNPPISGGQFGSGHAKSMVGTATEGI